MLRAPSAITFPRSAPLPTGCTSSPFADQLGIAWTDGGTGNEVILEAPETDWVEPIELTATPDQGTFVGVVLDCPAGRRQG